MKYWLMKAEPQSRLVKGKDVKFSVDDFEQVKTTPWEGVRNAEARNLMKEMTVGDKVLFYHSSCKVPGIAAFAEVTKEAYPDHTAWDSSHPYYDEKTDPDNPKWYMVDVTFKSRAKHYVPLPLLRHIAVSPGLSEDMSYIEKDDIAAIKEMALINRGRLSVQRVEEKTYDVIQRLSERGGWDETLAGTTSRKDKTRATKTKQDGDVKGEVDAQGTDISSHDGAQPPVKKEKGSRKRKAVDDGSASETAPLRRSTRTKK